MTKLNCSCGKQKDDCYPFRKIVIPAVMGDDSEDSPSAPENGAYVNALVEYEANGAMYMYASDGIFTKLSMVAGSAGAASISYVDTQDAKMLADAKAYTDAHAGEGGVSQTYVDQQDAATLSSAKSYADAKDATTLSSAKSYTDTEVAGTLQDAKDYADGVGSATLASANTAISTAITQANIPVITLSNVDIAEGSPLAANNFYGVYE